MGCEIGISTYTLLILYIKYAANENVHSMPCGVLNRKEIQKRGDICVSMMIHFALQ